MLVLRKKGTMLVSGLTPFSMPQKYCEMKSDYYETIIITCILGIRNLKFNDTNETTTK